MAVDAALRDAIAAAAECDVAVLLEISGGDVNRAARVELVDGRELFVKHRAGAPAGMYQAEADGLAWLADAGAVAVPRVAAVREAPPRLLALDWVERGAPRPDHDEELGRGLAALHRSGAPDFGWDRDNFIATIPQDNRRAAAWPEFYATRRIEPLARRARDAGLMPAATAERLSRLLPRLDDLCGPAEPPARLHGDLWGGNAITAADGRPVLIDPAVYGGHREVDLAMMRLFGGFGARVFGAYEEAFPLADGHRDRVSLYQLQPLLVHVNLFGAGYVGRLEHALGAYR